MEILPWHVSKQDDLLLRNILTSTHIHSKRRMVALNYCVQHTQHKVLHLELSTNTLMCLVIIQSWQQSEIDTSFAWCPTSTLWRLWHFITWSWQQSETDTSSAWCPTSTLWRLWHFITWSWQQSETDTSSAWCPTSTLWRLWHFKCTPGRFVVPIIHGTLTWTTGFVTCTCDIWGVHAQMKDFGLQSQPEEFLYRPHRIWLQRNLDSRSNSSSGQHTEQSQSKAATCWPTHQQCAHWPTHWQSTHWPTHYYSENKWTHWREHFGTHSLRHQ